MRADHGAELRLLHRAHIRKRLAQPRRHRLGGIGGGHVLHGDVHRRAVGGRGGEMDQSAQGLGRRPHLLQRFDLTVLDNMLMQDDAITRTEIWMALQLLLKGSVICQGPKYPAKTLDMGRDPALTIQLTGALRWGQSGVDPLQNVRAWSTLVQRKSGFKPRTVLLDPLAGDMLINSPTILRVMNSFRQTSGNIDLAGKTTGGAVGQEVAFLGSLPEFDFWQYQELYEAADGSIQQFMPDNTVILANVDALQGVKTYGAVKDRRAGFQPMPRFPKVWDVEEPAATLQNMASAPLPLFGWINASLAATVN